MLSILLSIFGIIFTIFFIIGIHEFCHFLAARSLGVKVLRFSIGFGKTIFRWHDKKGTEYVVGILPLGGYVSMVDESEGKVNKEDLPFAYNRQPFYKKFIIVLAGPLSNLVAAFVLYWLIFIIGFTSVLPVIGEVTPHSIAYEAGMKPNQQILKIDGHPIATWLSVMMRLFEHVGDKDVLTIETKNLQTQKIQTYTLELSNWHMSSLKPDPFSSLGILPGGKPLLQHIKYNVVTALPVAWREVSDFVWFNMVAFGKLIVGKISLQSMGGPISIFQGAGVAINNGVVPFLSFLAFINIAIGVINLIPIPGLDGGHILLQSIEAIRGRPIPLGVQFFLYRAGFVLLLIVIIQAVANDILRMF